MVNVGVVNVSGEVFAIQKGKRKRNYYNNYKNINNYINNQNNHNNNN